MCVALGFRIVLLGVVAWFVVFVFLCAHGSVGVGRAGLAGLGATSLKQGCMMML